MPNIQEFDAGNLKLQPTEVGVEARAGTARRIGMFYNQQAGAEDTLARETSRLASETSKLGSETAALGAEKGAALTETGRRLGSSVADAGAVAVKYLDHQQISQGAPAFARLMAQKTQEWNDTIKNANPNDPSVAQNFLNNSLEPALTKFKEEGFYTEAGQQWAESHTDALRQHLVEKSQADMSTMAGQAAVVNQQQTVNSLSSTVHSDPSSVNFAISALKSGTEGILAANPNMTATQANQVRSEILQKGTESIVKSAAIGYIEKTGQMPPWLSDPKYSGYVNGAEMKMLEAAVRSQQKRDELTVRQTEVTKRQIDNLNVHKQANKVLTDNASIDPQTGRPILNPKFFDDALQIAKQNPDASEAATTTRTMWDWAESQFKKEAVVISDPATTQALDDHLFAPDPKTGKFTSNIDLMEAEIKGKLSPHDFEMRKRLVDELEKSPLQGPVWQSTMTAVKDSLIVSVPGLPGKDNVGIANYSKFVQTFIPQYLAAERAGKLPPNALDVKDPTSMISQSLSQFKRTPADRMSDFVKGATGEGGIGAATAIPATQQMTRMIGDTPVPRSLNGIAALQFNKATGQFRDQTTGTIYDARGVEVKQ